MRKINSHVFVETKLIDIKLFHATCDKHNVSRETFVESIKLITELNSEWQDIKFEKLVELIVKDCERQLSPKAHVKILNDYKKMHNFLCHILQEIENCIMVVY